MVVFESYWGNTKHIAEVIAAELGPHATALHVDTAPDQLPVGLDLLVLGAPTHAFTLPSPPSRAEATKHGGAASTRGIREWMAQLAVPTPQPAIAVFDTRQGTSTFVGSAAKSAAKALRKDGFTVSQTAQFRVIGREGPLANGEAERAAEWARVLRSMASRLQKP